MEWLNNIWQGIKAYLWEGKVEEVTFVCHPDDYSETLDLAQAMRSDFGVPIAVKQGETVSVDDGEDQPIKPGMMLSVTKMTPSLFRGAYIEVNCFTQALEA